MVYHLLANAIETCILCQIGDVTVHLAIHLDIFDHVLAIGFQSAVEVVQVLDTAYLARSGVKQFGGQGLRQGVISLLLIARDKVKPIYLDHLKQTRNLVGRVLKVGIHGDHHITVCLLEATIQGRAFAVVATEFDTVYFRMSFRQSLNHIP